jgi:serine acetyltransferase
LVIANELETAKAMERRSLFLQMITKEDQQSIDNDVVTAPSMETWLAVLPFQKVLHVLVCFRVGHRCGRLIAKVWPPPSSMRGRYATDIHPACRIGRGIYLSNITAGVVIGETAVVRNDENI